jgi:hypothetical protein
MSPASLHLQRPAFSSLSDLADHMKHRVGMMAQSSLLARTVCRAGSGTGKPDTGRSHGLASADTARQTTLRSAQADPEPVFGIIKSVMGFRQFLLRGLVRGEWGLVTMAWNIKRMHALSLG